MYTENGHLKPKLSTSGVQIHRLVVFFCFGGRYSIKWKFKENTGSHCSDQRPPNVQLRDLRRI
jgi:hypothetical protein